jgi:hypothetical protein
MFDGQELDDRNLRVSLANPREEFGQANQGRNRGDSRRPPKRRSSQR